MKSAGIVTSLVFACALGGCGAAAPPRLAAARPAAASAQQQAVDGDFKGRALLGVKLSPACPGSSIGPVEIGDQKLYFAYKPDTLFVAAIQPDGSFHAASGPSLLDGSLAGDRLVFTVRTYVCSSVYELHRLT